jgi:DNA mismatch endonuclease (patch repair protein)
MADHLTPEARSANMRAVRRRDTEAEMKVRRLLHRLGYRYRLQASDLPGKPDIVFRGRRLAVFVHGCFWHGHDCRRGRLPASRVDFWRARIKRNRNRDERALDALQVAGWQSLVIWECELRNMVGLENRLRSLLGSASPTFSGRA